MVKYLFFKYGLQELPKWLFMLIIVNLNSNSWFFLLLGLVVVDVVYDVLSKPKLRIQDIIRYGLANDVILFNETTDEPIFMVGSVLYYVRTNSKTLDRRGQYTLFRNDDWFKSSNLGDFADYKSIKIKINSYAEN